MASLILYVTEHCSLCDTALELLLSMPELAGWSLTTLDIAVPDAVSAQAFAELGPRLPVLALTPPTATLPEQTLDWPFTAHQVKQLLGHPPVD